MSARDRLARRFQPGIDRLLRGDFSRIVRAFRNEPPAPGAITVAPLRFEDAIGDWPEPDTPADAAQPGQASR